MQEEYTRDVFNPHIVVEDIVFNLDWFKSPLLLSEKINEDSKVRLLEVYRKCKRYELWYRENKIIKEFHRAIAQAEKSGRRNDDLMKLLKLYPWLDYYFPERLTPAEYLFFSRPSIAILDDHKIIPKSHLLKSKLSPYATYRKENREEIFLKSIADLAYEFFKGRGIDLNAKGMMSDGGGACRDPSKRFSGVGVDLLYEFFHGYDPSILAENGNKIPPAVIRHIKKS